MKRSLIAALLLATTGMGAFAQEAEEKVQSDNFVSLQGGAQMTLTNADHMKLVWPVGMLSIGRHFTPIIGARISVMGMQARGGYNAYESNHIYNFKFVTANADAMLNLNNLIKPSNTWACDLSLIAGVGMAHAWDRAQTDNKLAPLGMSSAWEKDKQNVINGRVGLQADWKVAKHISILFEADANFLGDKFNGKTNGHCDIQPTAMFGMAYRFGAKHKKAKVVQEPAEPVEQRPVEQKPVVKQEQPKPAVQKPAVKQTTSAEVYYALGSSKPSKTEEEKVARLAEWLKAHPTAKVTLTSYADKLTGKPAYNMQLSKKRSEAIARLLTEKYGIDAARIATDYKGDTVQPFEKNELNRVTIAAGQE